MPRSKDAPKADNFSYQKCRNKKWEKRYGNSVRVGRRDYSIVFCEVIIDDSRDRIAGLCDPNNHAIYVDVTTEVESTLLHEICHAEIYEAGFHQREDWDSNLEEQIVECISQGIAHAFSLRKRS